jgi:hypothetical protein
VILTVLHAEHGWIPGPVLRLLPQVRRVEAMRLGILGWQITGVAVTHGRVGVTAERGD